ncbi:MAG TPA: hypothetical protein VMU84_09060, partial [Thermoanaerobaculia bacterium]|nr:hypothetical protein [Thermoanaerobaculia bacterium]
MRDEQVFRFMAVREPAKKQKKDVVKARTIEYSVTGAVPPLAQQFFAMSLEQRTRDAIRQTAVGFQQSNRYVPKITSLPLDLTLLARWVEDNSAKPLKDLDVPAFVNVAYGQTVADLANGAPFRESAERLAETVFADAMGDANVRRRRDDVVHAIKLLHLLRETAANSNLLKSDETLGEYLGRTVVVISELTRPREQPKDPVITPVPVREPDEVRVRREKLERLAAAHEELTQILSRPEALQSAPRGAQKGKVPGNCDPRIAVLEAHVAQLVSERQDPKKTELPKLELAPREIAARSGLSTTKPEISLSSQSAAILTNETKAVLQELNVDPQKVNPFAMVTLFETQISKLSESVPAAASPRRVIAFGGGHLDAQMFAATYGQSSGQINVSTLPSRIPCQYKAGLGDLLIVRQKLKAYELAEFAHVENVLMGETREREHRRLNLREEITTVESERETEKERDLQSTERNEMQNEASKTVQSQFQLEAGLQVSGSYGPAVSFSASLNTGFSTSTEETQRKAVTYSREVTDKTSERIRERVREERRVRVLEQVEEINSHKLQNTDAPKGHIRGIYRWLNKVYDAQIFNYGQRMMFEFVVPEPAAYLLYALIEN